MWKRCFILMLIASLLASCLHHRPKLSAVAVKTVPARAASSSTQIRPIASFNQVDVQGQINISLHTGYKQPQLILRGDPRDLAQVKAVVTQSTLYIVVGKGAPQYGAIDADIRGRFLNRIAYRGAGTIIGNQLHTSLLDLHLDNQGTTKLGGSIGLQTLDISGSGLTQINGISSHNLQVHLQGNPKVQLTGMVKLSKLNINGDGWLSLYWVKSDRLVITAKKAAKIQLAGIVNRLEVELSDTARFQGRYLRAQRSFVKTHDHSVAEISALNHQSNLASDASDIYYYNLPQTRADFMAFDGSVLDMRDWTQSDIKDYNRYNKQFP